MSKWSENKVKQFLKEKKDKKENINISSELFDTIVKLAIKKNSGNTIYYLEDLDIFCKKSELKKIASGMELAIRMGTKFKVPKKDLSALCKLNLIHFKKSALSPDRKFDAEKEHDEIFGKTNRV